ncbi:Golgi phosphoprotein 3 GPP34 [Asanoa ferruginea]|uniref:Golgi phosphoprotein 3 GPP34 n=1 Tax=Asanoa ferruginea TaxID=53367 RepID=A0A3D9ZWR1_9ACTN|nr:GPP34 family phosphoprotein [Asanoa ferruginea]REG01460.1 Golgi phosphoprotein 3 GPP34 [Asanoa ferruginea]
MSDLGLADELFMVGHNEYTGKTVINDEMLDAGLAGAALAELILQRRVTVVAGKLAVDDPRPWGDPVTDVVLREIHSRGSEFVPRAWVEHLRSNVGEVVAQRVVAAGMVRRDEQRSGLSRKLTVRYPAVNALTATRPLVRLSYYLQRPSQIDAQTATLAALVKAAGLEQRIMLEWSRQEVSDAIGAIVARLPAPLRDVIHGVEGAVAAMAVITRR